MNINPGLQMLASSMDDARKQNEFQRKMMMDAYLDQKRQMQKEERERNEPWRKAVGLVGTAGGAVIGGIAGGAPGAMAGAAAGGALGNYVGGMGLKGQEMGDPALLQQGLQTGLQAYAMKGLQDKYRGPMTAGPSVDSMSASSSPYSPGQLSIDPNLERMFGPGGMYYQGQ